MKALNRLLIGKLLRSYYQTVFGQAPTDTQGNVVLKRPPMVWKIGLVIFIIGAAGSVSILSMGGEEGQEVRLMGLGMAAFFLLVGMATIHFMRARVMFNEGELVASRLLGSVQIPLTDIQEVGYSRRNTGLLVIRHRNGVLRMPLEASGIVSFCEMLQRAVPAAIRPEVHAELEQRWKLAKQYVPQLQQEGQEKRFAAG